MKGLLLSAIEEVYNLKATPFGEIKSESVKTLSETYQSWDYLYGKQLPFNAVCSARLSFGSVEIQVCVEKCVITAVKLYTDSLDTELSKTVEDALILKTLDLLEIENALKNVLPTQQANELLTLFKEQLF